MTSRSELVRTWVIERCEYHVPTRPGRPPEYPFHLMRPGDQYFAANANLNSVDCSLRRYIAKSPESGFTFYSTVRNGVYGVMIICDH